ncbi:ABC1 kinase family protein [Jiangella alkaliphila]|uniref:Ubiquinone biosynthesis protein n=1 Tax=Jiangella alkaliphila TaxID=419479 RepID=A0A1H2K7D2_9ACTN|nr:AarF/UbiB family protein [Jiangella alkaliphila]SDU64371.1 ubiquinone biosynthesis protein [Jiangella alkaliphila]
MNVGALVVAGFVTLWIVLLSFAARRMLELRAGPVRLILAGAAGVGASAFALGQRVSGEGWPFVVLWIGIGVLAAMGVLLAGELVAPAGSRLRPLRWYRGFRQWQRRVRRYLQVSRIAARHGLGGYTSSRKAPLPGQRAELARRLGRALEEAGVAFVKFGQILSTRHDLLPPQFTQELGRLQSHVAPIPYEGVEALLEEEYGRPVDEVFAELDRTPLAAASISQVHRARLHTGEQVVVKVQRPGIGPIVDSDLDITLRIASMLERRADWARSIGLRELADGFAEALWEELDFKIEARNIASVLATHRSDDVVIAPTHRALCTSKVLVLDYLDGLPLNQAETIIVERGMDRDELARRLLRALLTQIMLDGVFLADPHPGNLLLLRDGRLGLLDFGSVGRLDPSVRSAFQRMLLAIETSDATLLTDSLIEIVERPEEVDEAGLERAIGRFMARHLGPGLTVDVTMFSDLFRLVTKYGVAVPPELAAVFRALATVEGTLAQLAPGFDIVAECRAFAGEHLQHAMHPDSLRSLAMAEAAKLLPLARRLPRRLDRLTSALEHGRFSSGTRVIADRQDRAFITSLVHQSLLTVLATAAGVVGAILLSIEDGPQLTTSLRLLELVAYSLLLLGGVLTLRVLTSILRR